MKKVLAVLLGLVLVLGLSSMALAGDEGFSYSGEFKLQYDSKGFSNPALSLKSVLTVNLSKTEGDVTAGISATIDPLISDTGSGTLKFSPSAYVTINNLFDTLNLTAASSVGLDVGTISGKGGLTSLPGIKVELVPEVVEGLSAAFVYNTSSGPAHNLGASGEFALEGLGKFGGAFAKDDRTSYAIWGSIAPVEGVTAKGEFDVDGDRQAYFAEAALSGLVEGLSVTAGYEGKNATWGSIDDNADVFGIHGAYYKEREGTVASNVYATASFALSETVGLNAGFGYLLSGAQKGYYVMTAGANVTVAEGVTVSGSFAYNSKSAYKLSGSASYVVDKATFAVNASYSYDNAGNYEIKPNVTYAFGAGVTGYAEYKLTNTTSGWLVSLGVTF